MFKSALAALFTLLMFMGATAFAGGGGKVTCDPEKVAGSYTLADPQTDVFDNSTFVAHTYIFQLNLHSDGTAYQYWTGFLDYPLETGSGSPYVGSWKCRNDGKLVVTVIHANYHPIPFGSPACGGPCVRTADIELESHSRSTYLFSVVNSDTLNRVQARVRTYSVTQDPSDPTAGTLGLINSTVFVYKRLKASDADLLLP